MRHLEVLVISLAIVIFGFTINKATVLENVVTDRLENFEYKLDSMEREQKKRTETPSTIVISINCVSPNQVEEIPIPDFNLSDAEIKEIATLVMAEAEGESELGQRLVIDTVFNRMDSLYFPSTVHDVLYQKNQFSCMWNGRYKRCYPKAELVALVNEELYSRTNEDVAFFTAHHYGRYGKPLFNEGHHYFCSIGKAKTIYKGGKT